MLALVLRVDFGLVLPRKVFDAAQARQIRVAVLIFAVVDLEDGGPVGQKEEMREAGAVHAHENVAVVRLTYLLLEGRANVVGDQLELDIIAKAFL